MSSTHAIFWTQQFMKNDGTPWMGVRVFHYVAGNTTMNLDVWQDAGMASAHNNPVVGDVSGRVSFYGSGTYRLLVMSSTEDGNLILYDWDQVELVHHTATVRAEDKALSLPAAYAAARGRIFGVVDGGGDLLSMWVQRTASAWASLLLQGTLTQMIEFAKGTDIASSADVTIPGDGNFFDITGTNDIETFSGFAGYPVIYTRTLDVLRFIHSSNLQMLSQMNRTTIAGQITCWIHIGAGQWVELFFTTISMFGDNNVTDGAVLLGNGTSAVTELALPTSSRVLSHIGSLNGGIDPAWMTGLLYHGPTAIAAGSTQPHEGTLIWSSNANVAGVRYASSFTVNAGVTLTIPAGGQRLVLVASDSITINGAINASGAGNGQTGNGFSQAAGGGGGHISGSGITVATAGGSALVHSIVIVSGGGGGGQNTGGGTPGAANGTNMAMGDLTSVYGGAGGGRGGFTSGTNAGTGGNGGGSIVLMAPHITFGSGSSLNTSGTNGSAGANAGGGGGGGGGNIYIRCQSYTDNGVTFTQTGGSGGGATGGGGGGGNGAAGVSQIMIYGT